MQLVEFALCEALLIPYKDPGIKNALITVLSAKNKTKQKLSVAEAMQEPAFWQSGIRPSNTHGTTAAQTR